jgi:TonB-linked SusC/RagA family outer membrane protein
MTAKLTNYFKIIPLWVWLLTICMPIQSFGNTNSLLENDAISITGQVTSAEDNETLIGVTVKIKDGSTGAITDFDGRYSIQAEATDILVFSYTGMETQEVTVDGRTKIDVQLKTDAKILEEVVVVGYGVQKKSHLTGSVSKVTNEKLDQIPMARMDDALVGQVAGVNIQATNPAAGEAPTIRVRGPGSITQGSSPLIVVDGIAVGTDADFLSSLDMNDVESIEVLKDAASSAIYGSRGANGIIMITTKAGVEGPARLSYDTYVGFKSVPDNDYLTSVSEWSDFVRENNGGVLTDKMEYINLLGTETDWQDVMMDGGMIQSHSLSARGGTKNTKYRASVSYLEDEGVLLTDNFSKLNFRLSIDTKINKRISFGTTLNPSYTTQTRFPIGLHDAIRQNAWLPTYLDESNIQYVNRFRESGRWADAQIGDYAMERMFDDFDLVNGIPDDGDGGTPSGTDISSTSNQSALAKVLERDRRKNQMKIYANTYVKVKILDGLNFKQTVGGDYRNTENINWTGIQASRNGAGDSESSLSTTNQLHIVSESTLNYSKDVGKHEVNAVAGYAFEQWQRDDSYVEAAGYTSDLLRTIPFSNLTDAYTYQEEYAMISYFGRVNYAYDDKYLISVTSRWDGSSKFGANNKFGYFPSVSAGWRVSQESFMQNVSFIEELKLRASYGITGNNAIDPYLYVGLLDPISTGFGSNGFNPINIANEDLRWEQLLEFNTGLDLAILNGRFRFGFDYYNRTSEDLLLELPVPGVTGFDQALVNQGIVENKGFELEITSNNYSSKNFSWSTTGLLTHNRNTLIDFAGASGLISIVDDKRAAEWIALEGYPISSFYGYVVDKEIPLESIRNPFYPINAQSQDIYVKDLNGDGIIDTDDRTLLGSPYPDFIWSITNNIRYGGFDFTFMFQGSHGAEVRNISSQYIKNEFSSNQDYVDDFADADKVVERIFTNDDIQDASYVALRNLNIGYTFDLKNKGISKLRIYAGGQNLLYFMAEGYEGFNPEGVDLSNDTERRPTNYGYQRRTAPIYRTLNFGLNLGF